ncbi:MAG: DEAD/DEAH box helicase [Planctomycetaceae bacterium]
MLRRMSIQPVITPSGHLIVESVADDDFTRTPLKSEIVAELQNAFDESAAAGLERLASGGGTVNLSADFLYWREFALQFFHQLCSVGEEELRNLTGAKAKAGGVVEPPAELTLVGLIESAPPMRGLDYLTPDVLRRLWADLQSFVLRQAADYSGGPVAYLRSVNPLWNLLGRVTFHLAENKRDPDRPFAFLATYTHRLSARAKLQHLPLGEALKQYAGENNQAKLVALLEPVQKAAAESPLVREMLDSRQLFQPHALTISQAHRFLTSVPVMEQAGLVVRVPNWWKAKQATRPEVQVRIGQKKSSQVGMDGIMDFAIDVALEGEPLTKAEREQILQATDGLALLRGKWVEVDSEKLQQALDHWHAVAQQHGDGIDFIQGMRLLAGVPLDRTTSDDDVAGWTRVTSGEWLSETLQHLRDPSGIVDCEPGQDLQAKLRPYQVDGVRWLWFMTRMGLGACLADDMGLGKTIQIIDLLLMLKREASAAKGRKTKTPATSLLVVPASLVGNWKSELERFAPALKVFYAHRSECDAATLTAMGKSPATSVAQFDLIVTTYGLARRLDWLSKSEWRLIVLDEAQAIKNASSAQAKAVRKLKSSGRIVLSGTPVENHLGELWSLFDFCCPGLLGNANQFKRFVKSLGRAEDKVSYGGLRSLVRPYILRRLKTDPGIVPDLPDKTEMRTECGLSKKQATLYQKTLHDLEKRLQEADGMERRGLVLATLMQLKQICNHASQFLRQDDYKPQDSGKFQRLELLCQPIIQRQERMLVFTQFQSLTEPLADFLASVFGRRGLVLHGGVPVKKRQQLVAAFQADDGPPFFVISVKAGGTGLNLTAASHVVHFDRWWNPAVENQATDRAFRIGQKRNVLVHKFVCRGTVEERIDEMIRDKQELADEILTGGAEARLTEMSDEELLDFVAIDLSRASTDDN